MNRLPRLLVAALVAAFASPACSDGSGDTLERACRVIVEGCGVGPSMSDCVDALGYLPPDCLSCIADADCGYATCQRTAACRIPLAFTKSE